jgi:hypothetical protein
MMFADDRMPARGSREWESRLDDFARLCLEVRQNLAGLQLSRAQAQEALRVHDPVLACFLEHFFDLGPRDRLVAGCETLRKLLRWAVDGPLESGGYAEERTLALDAHRLQNAAHTDALDLPRIRLTGPQCPGTCPLDLRSMPAAPVLRRVTDGPRDLVD